MSLSDEIKEYALDLGFCRVGITDSESSCNVLIYELGAFLYKRKCTLHIISIQFSRSFHFYYYCKFISYTPSISHSVLYTSLPFHTPCLIPCLHDVSILYLSAL